MDRYIALKQSDKRDYCQQAGEVLGLPPNSIEKDFWVCWTLRELFALPNTGQHLTFKGGTSLSKGWGLIKRLSEDIDIVLSRDFLGFCGDQAPDQPGIGSHERERRLMNLRSACQTKIRESLEPEFRQRANDALDGYMWRIEVDPDDGDRQTLLFHYPSAVQSSPYVLPVVRIELGARSDTEPVKSPRIEPYLYQALSDILGNAHFEARTVTPERTFWEKTSLLHEQNCRVSEVTPRPRLARHYYDLWCLIKAGVAAKAAADLQLFHRVIAHRKVFFRKTGSQESLEPGKLRLIPATGQMSSWKSDYNGMREMIFEEPPEFEEILLVIADFGREFKLIADP